ncbi:MAG TPA: hypothetical protein GXX75_25365 [Clostridiales bacterium]|nr:hypothetical protein [Clostridiales bacterium]
MLTGRTGRTNPVIQAWQHRPNETGLAKQIRKISLKKLPGGTEPAKEPANNAGEVDKIGLN